jgi:hypothetical protein
MKNALLIIFVVLGLFYACNSGKYVAGFSKVKKGIDTLEVLPIDLQINIVDFLKVQKTDPQLEKIVKVDILDQIKTVLNKKYKIVISDSTISKSQLCLDLEKINYFIESQKNPLNDIQTPSSFNDLKKSLRHKYSLFLIVRSQYCINFPDNTNALWIDPMVNTYITQYLFLFDNLNNKILHYKKTKTVGNISIKLSVEQITLESLRNIYYK